MRRSLRTTTIATTPKVFLNHHHVPILIKLLAPEDHHELKAMYLRFTPRAVAGGLPPASTPECLTWVEQLISSGINIVATGFDRTVVGHAVILPMRKLTCEMLIAVEPCQQKSGIGSQLLRSIIQLAYELGFHRMWLSVEKTNFIAIHLYTKFGFERLTFSDSPQLEMALDLRRYRPTAKVKVKYVMNRDVVTINRDASCAAAIEIFLHHNVATLPVITDDRTVIGILSQTDLLFKSHFQQKVSEVATRNVVTLYQECTIQRAIQLFQGKKLRSIPIVDRQKKLVGIVTRQDILAYYYKNHQQFSEL